MSEHIEAMCRAMCAADGEAADDMVLKDDWGKSLPLWHIYEDDARAALLALAASVRERGLPDDVIWTLYGNSMGVFIEPSAWNRFADALEAIAEEKS